MRREIVICCEPAFSAEHMPSGVTELSPHGTCVIAYEPDCDAPAGDRGTFPFAALVVVTPDGRLRVTPVSGTCTFIDGEDDKFAFNELPQRAIVEIELAIKNIETVSSVKDYRKLGFSRYVLYGLRMRHVPTDQLFTCGGSFWDKLGNLVLYKRFPVRKPGCTQVEANPGRFASPADIRRYYVPYSDDEKVFADECVLLDKWPQK